MREGSRAIAEPMSTRPLCLVALFLLGTPFSSRAGLLAPVAPYGIDARDAATAGALASFTSGFSAAITNPASLGQPGPSELTLGYLYSRPSLSLGGEAVAASPGNVAVFGIKLDLSGITEAKIPVGFGLALALDDAFQTLLALSDAPSAEGSFLREGRSQLLLVPAVGVQLTPWLRVGGGAEVAVTASAALQFRTTLDGQTSQQQMHMHGGSAMAPEVGVALGPWDLGSVQKFSLNAAFHTAAYYALAVDANAEATVGSSPLTTLPLQMSFIDAYRPNQISLAARASFGNIDVGAELSYGQWSALGALLAKDDIVRGAAGLSFSDILIPRVGVDVHLGGGFDARAGYAFKPSPLRDPTPSALNAIDNSRHVGAVGLGWTLPGHNGVFKEPLSLDVAYQLELLARRDFTLIDDSGSARPATAGGLVHALNANATIRF
jgi:long-subunit fatty acid transport protein